MTKNRIHVWQETQGKESSVWEGGVGTTQGLKDSTK